MNEVYKALMPDPKPARATVQVAGLIGGAKIESPRSQSSSKVEKARAQPRALHHKQLKGTGRVPMAPNFCWVQMGSTDFMAFP